MPKSSAHAQFPATTTSDRPTGLIEAFLTLMAETGPDGASARTVSARAGTSPSAINYHFGSIEHLYGLAQTHALALATAWLDSRLQEVEPCSPWPASAFGAFAAPLLHCWCEEQRPLAQAEATAFLTSLWRPDDAAPVWLRLWEDFWLRAFPLFSLDPTLAPIGAAMLHSERLGHLARWKSAFDRAALEEVCNRVAGRIAGDVELISRPTPWRERAEALSREAVNLPLFSGPAARIAGAVVSAVDEGGEAALTHRAAAAKAGVSLGAVAYHFPTRSALMGAGYSSLYHGIVDTTRRVGGGGAKHGDLGRHILSFLDIGRTTPHARALEAFFVAATREPALADFAARVRYSRGLSTLDLLAPEAPNLNRLDALLISHWTAGAGRADVAAPDRSQEAERLIRRHAQALFST